MSLDTWALFLVTETVLCLTPGPAVLVVLSQALRRGAAASLWPSLGILAGNTLYFAVSATGLAVIVVASYELFFAIKWLGAAYLVWLGITTFLTASAATSVGPAALEPAAGRLLVRGFLVQVANPKALVFFTALLPQFIDPSGNVPLQVAILGVTSVVVEFLVLASYGAIAGNAAHLASRPTVVRSLQRAGGVLLLAAGLRMAALRRE